MIILCRFAHKIWNQFCKFLLQRKKILKSSFKRIFLLNIYSIQCKTTVLKYPSFKSVLNFRSKVNICKSPCIAKFTRPPENLVQIPFYAKARPMSTRPVRRLYPTQTYPLHVSLISDYPLRLRPLSLPTTSKYSLEASFIIPRLCIFIELNWFR